MSSPRAAANGMPRVLCLENRQRCRRVDTAALRRLARWVLDEQLAWPAYELCIHLIDAGEMARLNWDFLQHEGSTDIITFDHAPAGEPVAWRSVFTGELFISIPDAVAQAGEFQTTWQAELARYVIHGFLHLAGYDDRTPADRKRMKAEEGRLVRAAAAQWDLANLEKRK